MDLIHFVLYPGFHGIILLFSWALSKFFSFRNWTQIFGWSFTLWLTILFFTPIPRFLLFSKERRYPPISVNHIGSSAPKTNILILGAGKISDPSLSYLSQLSQTELSRLVEGLRIYRFLKSANFSLQAIKANIQTFHKPVLPLWQPLNLVSHQLIHPNYPLPRIQKMKPNLMLNVLGAILL